MTVSRHCSRRRQPLQQRRIFPGAHAVIDALHLQHIQCTVDVGRRTFLAGMGGDMQPQLARAGEHPGELGGGMAQL